MSSQENVIRIPPQKYLHVLDSNSNITRLEVGPAIFIRKEHESVVAGPLSMINLQPRTYIKISNPVLRKGSELQYTDFGQVKIRHGDFEIRTADEYQDPFPLYPGESCIGKIEKLLIVTNNQALRLRASRDFTDNKVKRVAGEEWQRIGPFTYVPKVEEEVVSIIKAEIIKINHALKLRALKPCKDVEGVPRKTGEEWLIRKTGAYLPDVNEKVVENIKGQVLTDKQCIHLRALKNFTDCYKKPRKAGEEWIITNDLAQIHIRDVYEEIVGVEKAITLSSRQYCVILNPQENYINQWGRKKLIMGEQTFFLQPGESLEKGVQSVSVLGEEESLLLLAKEAFTDTDGRKVQPGDRWMISGPRDYVPPVEVTILEKRTAIPLDENEGIYIRDLRSGEIKLIKGETYLLKAHEVLWEKELPPLEEELLALAATGMPYVPPKQDAQGNLIYDQKVQSGYKRDKNKIVKYKAPHNTAIQLYDYKLKKSRVCFGPSLVILGPDEQFTVLALSGGKPKRENVIKTLSLSLGPDFMTDIVIVETSDHARLSLNLTYTWQFNVDREKTETHERLFSVKDFVGDACKGIASRIRGAVSAINFEDFHHHSSAKIKEAVFGKNKETGQIREQFLFPANNLCINSVDINNVEITDPTTRANLQRSINLAIDISTKSREATYKHQNEILDQEARGQLEIQKLEDAARAEESKIKLLERKAESEFKIRSGEALANARAETESKIIQAEAQVKNATLKAAALKIESDAEIEQLSKENEAEVKHKRDMMELEVKKAQQLAEIEIKKFKQIVGAIGKETLVAISKAGPEMKAKLLKGLGLSGYLVTDGKNPINLFNTAQGMVSDKMM